MPPRKTKGPSGPERFVLHSSGAYWHRVDAQGVPVKHHRYSRPYAHQSSQESCSHGGPHPHLTTGSARRDGHTLTEQDRT